MKEFLSQCIEEDENKPLWQLYHCNSKISRYTQFPSTQQVVEIMRELYETMQYPSYKKIMLPTPLQESNLDLMHAIKSRVTPNDLKDVELSLEQLSTLLFAGYGKNREGTEATANRIMRTVPSGGALFPIDLYVHIRNVKGLNAGLYHFDPVKHELSVLREGDQIEALTQHFPQKNLLKDTSVQIFIVGMFERSTFKYGETGYRFTFIEAGHIGQNVSLASEIFNLATVCVGGYYGATLDRYLGFDGVNQSVIYVLCIGASDDKSNS